MRKTYKIRGMHCRSCEMLIEENVRKISGVDKARASSAKKALYVDGRGWKDLEIERAVISSGYALGEDVSPFFSREKSDYLYLLYALLALGFSFVLFSFLGITDLINLAPSGIGSLWLVFGVGLTAGISTCMAVVGGLVLALSAKHAEKFQDATPIQKFRPHLYFNAGRIFFYTVFGALIGLLGGAIKVSPFVIGLLTVLVGVVMILIGIQLSGIAPGFSGIFTLPKGMARFLRIGKDREYSHINSFLLGGATFFLPCGFTQAMQLLAIASASPVRGAAIMGVFALGTAPSLLGLGGITAALRKGKLTRFFYKVIAVLVIAMALYNIQNGLNLLGYQGGNTKSNTKRTVEAPAGPAMTTNGVTIYRAVYSNDNPAETIKPYTFTFRVGKPARIDISAREDGVGCMGTVMIPGLVGEPQYFKKGETVVLSFTPDRVGTYRMTCAMGIQSGEIIVTE